jgi:hypothetical protein
LPSPQPPCSPRPAWLPPLAHPEIPLADGRLLVSVSRNTTDFDQLMADPEVGRPIFVEVGRP